MDIQSSSDAPVDAADAPEPAPPEIDPALLRSLEEPRDGGEPPPEPGPVEARDPDASEATPSEGATAEDAATEDDVEDPFAAVALTTRIEALLFAAPEPLTLRRLRDLLAVDDAGEVREAVQALAHDYEASGRAFQIAEVAGGFQLRTREDLAPLVGRLRRRRAPDDRLSAAAMETLAIVAYRQPVLRADVEKIRGVACGEVLRSLMERGLVRVAGRAELPGSPLLYGTTTHFLEVFGLRNLRDLPQSP